MDSQKKPRHFGGSRSAIQSTADQKQKNHSNTQFERPDKKQTNSDQSTQIIPHVCFANHQVFTELANVWMTLSNLDKLQKYTKPLS